MTHPMAERDPWTEVEEEIRQRTPGQIRLVDFVLSARVLRVFYTEDGQAQSGTIPMDHAQAADLMHRATQAEKGRE